MTSIDFLNKVHKSLDSQEYNLSYSPAKSKNYHAVRQRQFYRRPVR